MALRIAPRLLTAIALTLCASQAAFATPVDIAPTFTKPVDYGTELTGAQWVAVGDVKNRGIADLVVTHANAYPGHVSLLLGNGRGTFGTPHIVFSGTPTDEVVEAQLADVNDDKKLDLVMLTTTSDGGSFFTVALGDGKGHFAYASQTAFPNGRFVLGKFGNDTLPDIFVQAPYALQATIYRSDGKGGFKAPLALNYGGGAGGLVASDVNHDGIVDLVGIGQGVKDSFGERLQTLFGESAPRYFSPPRYTLPGLEELYAFGYNSGITAAVGDLRGSGSTDLVVFGSDAQVGIPVAGSVYLGHADGSFDPPLLVPTRLHSIIAHGSAAAIADFNGDGAADILLAAFVNYDSASTCYILRGVGDGTFPVELQTIVPVVPLYPHVEVADLNGDGRADIVLSDQTGNRGVWVLLNTTGTK